MPVADSCILDCDGGHATSRRVVTVIIDGFTDVRRIGSGGLGDVYSAIRESTGSMVAIKVLRDWSDEAAALVRSRRELEALVGLRGHAHVVQIEEVRDIGGVAHLIMEHAPDGSLADLADIRRRAFGAPEVVMIGLHTASALVASHERGIVHLDIKPANLLIGGFGQIKVCDFGIAALTQTETYAQRTSAASIRYASPEQLDDADVGPPSDMFSLGATLAQLLLGTSPPARSQLADPATMMAGWVAGSPESHEVASALQHLVVSCLDSEPDARPTAEQCRDEFERLVTLLGQRRCRALPLVGGDGETLIPPDTLVDSRPSPAAATSHLVASGGAPPPGWVSIPSGPAPSSDGTGSGPDGASESPAGRHRVVLAIGAVALVVIAVGIVALLTRSGDDRTARGESGTDTGVSVATEPIGTAEPDAGGVDAGGTAAPDAGTASVDVPVTSSSPVIDETSPTTPAGTSAPSASAPLTPVPPTSAPGPVIEGQPTPTAAPPPVIPTIAQVSATVIRPDSQDACGNTIDYRPINAVDGDRSTAWMTPGDGSGVAFTIVFDQPSVVTEVGLVPGYDKFDPCTSTDRFFEFRRVTSVRWTFDDATTIDQLVNPTPDLQTIAVGRPLVTSSVTMTILTTAAPGNPRLDHTPVSEIVAS